MPESEDNKPKPIKPSENMVRKPGTVRGRKITGANAPVRKPTSANSPVSASGGGKKNTASLKTPRGSTSKFKTPSTVKRKTGSNPPIVLKGNTGKMKAIKPTDKDSSKSTRKRSAASSKHLAAHHGGNIASDAAVVKKQGMGLAAKFSIPVCILIAFAIGGWGYWIGKNIQDSMVNDIKKTGVTSISILDKLGKQILSVREIHKGAWPIVIGILTRDQVADMFGEELEKKILKLGFPTPKDLFTQLDTFNATYAINKNNSFKEAKDIAEALGFKNVEAARKAVGKLRSVYAGIINMERDIENKISENPYNYDSNWSGMSDAPLELFDTTKISNLINKYTTQNGVLANFLKISTAGGESVHNEVLDAYIIDRLDKLVASTRPTDSNNDISLSDRVDISTIKINREEVKTNDVSIEWCNVLSIERATKKEVKREPALHFRKEIMHSKGSKIGACHLAISAKIIDEEKRSLQFWMGAVGLGAVFVAAMLCIIIAGRVTAPLQTLIKDMDIVAQGELTHKTVAHSSDEIGAVATQFNHMTQKLLDAQAAEKEAQRIEDELERAREIQMGLLPAKIPSIKGLDIFATYHPAKEVGGDYYDFYPIDKEHLGIIVADVSGKGIPGSMVMGTTRTILRFSASGNNSASDTLAKTNRVVAMDIRRGMFVTAMYVVLHARTHDMLVASAGHNPMAIYRAATNDVEMVNPNGIALGFDKGPLFQRTIKEVSVTLGKGDRVVLYTDGVVEAMNEESEEYSNERFIDFIKDNKELSSKDFVAALLDDLNRHKGSAEQHDDITIVTFRAK